MADDIREDIGALTAAIRKATGEARNFGDRWDKGSDNLLSTWTEMVRVGKQQLLLDKGGESLARQMRQSGLTLGESFAQVGTAIKVGFRDYKAGAKNTLTGITKLGLSEKLFAESLAFNTEILGMNLNASDRLVREMVTLGSRFHIDSNFIAQAVKSSAETSNKISNQYGAGASKGFQSALAYMTAAGGVQFQGAVQELMGLVAGSTAKEFTTAIKLGGTGGLGDRGAIGYRDAASRLLDNIADRFDKVLGGGDISFMADVAANHYGISQQLLALAKRNRENNLFDSKLGGNRFDSIVSTQQRLDFVRAWNTMIATIQAEFIGLGIEYVTFITSITRDSSNFVKEGIDNFKKSFNITDTSLSDMAEKFFTGISDFYNKMTGILIEKMPESFDIANDAYLSFKSVAMDHVQPAADALKSAAGRMEDIFAPENWRGIMDLAKGDISTWQAIGGWDADTLARSGQLSETLGIGRATDSLFGTDQIGTQNQRMMDYLSRAGAIDTVADAQALAKAGDDQRAILLALEKIAKTSQEQLSVYRAALNRAAGIGYDDNGTMIAYPRRTGF